MRVPTFLFTDIEGSTAKWEKHRDSMSTALARHDSILQKAVEEAGGRLLKHTGDGMIAVFENGRALECAIVAQAAMQEADWSDVEGLRVRMCVFAGGAEERDGDYFGPALNGAARMLSAAWGGLVLVNDEAAGSELLPEGAALTDAGVHVLRDLMEPQQIHLLAHPSLSGVFPALRTVSSRPQNLPVQPTPFHGRARELDEVCALLESPDCRLLTILAPGGTGKSRLALQAAARMITGFRHGAFFAMLEDIPSADMIPAAIASTMSFRFSGPVPEEEQLAAFLSDREVLVIADNFEHLSNDSPILSRLLARSPGLKFMVTSRHRLNLREERVYELQGMDLPAPDGADLEERDASGLFLASADRAAPGYRPGKDDRRAIASICKILDGSPLGIELASSWVRMVQPCEIEKQLRRNFELLDSAPLDMPGRHRGLEAVFEYSWSLLDEREREALSGLSIFAGEFDAEAASKVTGSGLPLLRRLLDKSLLQCPSQGRFGMHPIIHAYAAAKLEAQTGRLDDLRERHARHFAGLLMAEKPEMQKAGTGEALRKVEDALPNILQAWDHAARLWTATENRVFFGALAYLFIVRSTLATAKQVFSRKLEVFRARWGADPKPDQAGILGNIIERLATFENLSGLPERSRPLLEEALKLAENADDQDLEPRILGTLGVLEAQANQGEEARRIFHRMLEKLEAVGHRSQMSVAFSNLATLDFLDGNYQGAAEYYRRSLDVARENGDVVNQMRTLGSMGFMWVHAGESEKAFECFGESLEMAKQVGDRRSQELALLGMADLLAKEEPARAMDLAEECLCIAESIQHTSMKGHACLVMATIHAYAGRKTLALEARERAIEATGGDFDEAANKRLAMVEQLVAEIPD